jgi:hypothetical protein
VRRLVVIECIERTRQNHAAKIPENRSHHGWGAYDGKYEVPTRLLATWCEHDRCPLRRRITHTVAHSAIWRPELVGPRLQERDN